MSRHIRRRKAFFELLEDRRLLALGNVPVIAAGGNQYDPALGIVGNNVVAAFSAVNNGNTGFATSNNLAESFALRGSLSGEQPSMAVDPVRGRMYIATATFQHLYVNRTDDGGATILPQVSAITSENYFLTPKIAVDTSTGSGNGNVYVLVRRINASPPGVELIRSMDGGDSWSSPVLVSSDGSAQGGWLVVAPDHSVDAFFMLSTGGANRIVMRQSTDGGHTFGPLITVANQHGATGTGALGTNFNTNGYPQVVANPVNGDLYATFADDPSGPDRGDIMFTMSTDGGATWSTPATVNDDNTNNDQWRPTLAVSTAGDRLFFGWQDRRLDPANNLTTAWGSLATINGHTVIPGGNFRISQVSSPAGSADYDTAIAAPSGFYYAWSVLQGSSGFTPNQNIFLATISSAGPAGPYVSAQTPGVAYSASQNVGSVTVQFSESMDTSSFDPAVDVPAFFGPGGETDDLRSTITGFSWLDDRTLQVNFTPLNVTGTYHFVIGPNVLSATGQALDNNFNGITGESGDIYDAFFQLYPHYNAYAAPAAASLALTAGAPGVTPAQPQNINLGNRTFTFYGQQYTGASLRVQAGTLSLGSSGFPVPTIYVGSGGSQAYYAFRDETGDGVDDLIVDWHSLDGRSLFQAVLELGTGARQGSMLFNYLAADDPDRPDLLGAYKVGVASAGNASQFIAYQNGYGDIGIRPGMGLVIRDDRSGKTIERFAGIAHVFGTPGDDTISVEYVQAFDRYYVNGPKRTVSLAATAIKGIYLHGGDGNDRLVNDGQRGGDCVGLDGGLGDDVLLASSFFSTAMFGGAGKDTISSIIAANDQIEGGPGSDEIFGGDGDDTYYFAAKATNETDVLADSGGQDRLDFSMLPPSIGAKVMFNAIHEPAFASHAGRQIVARSDTSPSDFDNAIGGAGNDFFQGSRTTTLLDGGSGDDTILAGGYVDDVLIGGPGSDLIGGSLKTDVFLFRPTKPGAPLEQDRVLANHFGNAILDFSALPASVNLVVNLAGMANGHIAEHAGRVVMTGNADGSLPSFHEVIGGSGNDRITGDGWDNILRGGPGNDILNGGPGNDQLFGGLGDDRYVFGVAKKPELDQVFEAVGAGVDELDFSALGDATPVVIDLSSDTIATHANRTVKANGSQLNFENATGGAGDDHITGNPSNNRLVGGPGKDTLIGGGGWDRLVE
jgi:hypothetical protein